MEPEAGINTTIEAAHQILAITALADLTTGTTVTPTVCRSGRTSNTVPDLAELSVDVRVASAAEHQRVDAAMHALTPVPPGAGLTVEGGPNRPPLDADSSAALFRLASELAHRMGPPTLDGLGAAGDHAHAEGEWVSTAAMPDRAALLAARVKATRAPGNGGDIVATDKTGVGRPAPPTMRTWPPAGNVVSVSTTVSVVSSAFEGQVVIVTGAAGGIGEATAEKIAAAGGKVVVADVREDAARQTAARLEAAGYEVLALPLDVTVPGSPVTVVEKAVAEWGRVDVLVNNAGIESYRPFLEIAPDDYARVMAVNATGVWNCCQAVLPVMLEQRAGSIVNVSSVAGQRGGGLFGTSAYAASKGAVLALTKGLAREFAPMVRCNAVCPALTLTPMVERVIAEKGEKGGLERVMSLTPMGRPGEPAEVAAVIAFLASAEASYVTGHIYNVDGGVGI